MNDKNSRRTRFPTGSLLVARVSRSVSLSRGLFASAAALVALTIALVDSQPAKAGNPAFAGSRAGRIFRNGGTTGFSANSTPSLSAVYNGVDFINANVGFAVGVDPTNFNFYAIKTTNGGTWSVMNTGVTGSASSGFLDVDFTSNSNGWIVGEGGRIIATTNGGTNWTAQTSLVSANLYGVQFLSPSQGFVVGDGGVVLTTTNGGGQWSPISVPANLSLHAVDFVDPLDGWVAGSNTINQGVIARTTNGGSSWSLQTFADGLNDVAFTNNQTGWAVGNGGLALKTTNAGVTWTTVSMNTTQPLNAVSWLGTQEAYIVGGDGSGGAATIRHTADGGQTWQSQVDNGFGNPFHDISLVSANSTTVSTGSNVTQSLGGGPTTIGGSTVVFPTVNTQGTLEADPTPLNLLPQQTQTDLTTFPGYQLVGANPIGWQVSFDGTFTGLVTIDLGYDPSVLAGLDPTKLRVLHRNNTTGVVTVLNATLIGNNEIQVQSPGFSTFALAVPEPSTWALLVVGAIGLVGAIRIRSRNLRRAAACER